MVQPHGNPWKRAALVSGILAAAILGFVVLRTCQPTDESWLPKCVMHRITGLHCPGCGATRACAALAHGDLMAALRYNAMLVLGMPMLLLATWWHTRHQRASQRTVPLVGWLTLVIVLTFFVVRNLPSPATSPLAPPPWPSES